MSKDKIVNQKNKNLRRIGNKYDLLKLSNFQSTKKGEDYEFAFEFVNEDIFDRTFKLLYFTPKEAEDFYAVLHAILGGFNIEIPENFDGDDEEEEEEEDDDEDEEGEEVEDDEDGGDGDGEEKEGKNEIGDGDKFRDKKEEEKEDDKNEDKDNNKINYNDNENKKSENNDDETKDGTTMSTKEENKESRDIDIISQ